MLGKQSKWPQVAAQDEKQYFGNEYVKYFYDDDGER